MLSRDKQDTLKFKNKKTSFSQYRQPRHFAGFLFVLKKNGRRSVVGRLLPVGENRINSCADSLQSTHFGLPDYYYKSLNTNNLFQFILNINETAVDPKATVIDF